MGRTERETMLSVLLDLEQSIPSWVLREKETKEEAEKYIQKIKDANDLINKTFGV